ncbi:hypothetical protein [Rhodococcus tukisamuensis]|uniref:Uncharacterized protein n=1 Tax=Rhodococcus tukisamuensis TaxID=168276 RepID=A0A1G6R9H8_9NOCA|nr:hypothetical protein [Rhodococcus tukisamuensis]SDD01300.1 hypothetical protein SAMN05444580_102391 [Rhodococcus tukisamuensis]
MFDNTIARRTTMAAAAAFLMLSAGAGIASAQTPDFGFGGQQNAAPGNGAPGVTGAPGSNGNVAIGGANVGPIGVGGIGAGPGGVNLGSGPSIPGLPPLK